MVKPSDVVAIAAINHHASDRTPNDSCRKLPPVTAKRIFVLYFHLDSGTSQSIACHQVGTLMRRLSAVAEL